MEARLSLRVRDFVGLRVSGWVMGVRCPRMVVLLVVMAVGFLLLAALLVMLFFLLLVLILLFEPFFSLPDPHELHPPLLSTQNH